MKFLILTLTLIASFSTLAQDCSKIKRTSKKLASEKAKGATVASKDHFAVMIQKHFDPKNPNDTINYSVMVLVASRYMLSDSVTRAAGSFEFELSNGQTLIWENATANNLGNVTMSVPNTHMFHVKMSAKQLEPLSIHTIKKLRMFRFAQTGFDQKSQEELRKIAGCLITTTFE
jgi:hypothetical protein